MNTITDRILKIFGSVELKSLLTSALKLVNVPIRQTNMHCMYPNFLSRLARKESNVPKIKVAKLLLSSYYIFCP
jgi:hypothetical protein